MPRRRLSALLGLSPQETDLLADRARRRLGGAGFASRLIAFSLATAPGLRRALPRRLRIRAVRPLVYALLPGPSENELYVEPDGG